MRISEDLSICSGKAATRFVPKGTSHLTCAANKKESVSLDPGNGYQLRKRL